MSWTLRVVVLAGVFLGLMLVSTQVHSVQAGMDATTGPTAEVVVIEATGPVSATIQSAVDQFRSSLGANNGVGGAFDNGRREVNWDGVPAASLDPFPGDFFRVRSPRGIEFFTPGTRMKVSGDPDTPSFEFADVTARLPGSGEPWGPIELSTFSPFKMFAPIDSVITDLRFHVPGTNTPATVTAFGAVFVDVDLAATTRIELYDVGDTLIYSHDVPVSGVQSEGLSFVGVRLPIGERALRVRLIAGSHPINTGFSDPPPDGVGIDDVIFAEPEPSYATYLPYIGR